jgi:uncharacterized membrane protein YozB (DUF420 family)
VDVKLIFWCAALANFAAVVAAALTGWRHVRRGDVARHRRWMNAAAALVALFLASYAAKVIVLGREPLAAWSPAAVVVLRVHETIVAAMLVAGAAARLLARRLAPGAAPAAPRLRRRHRWSGRTALVAGVFALVTATMILVGMFLRA